MELILKHPIELGKLKVAKLSFRSHTTANDYLAFDQRGGVAQRIALIANIAGTDEEIVKKLAGPDYQKAAKIVDDMIAEDEASLFPEKEQGTSEEARGKE